ncbi:hypothetical protein NPIL_310621 [Nephila pilipes]|uniref:Uncharacterized protein n=1 Tax=Nephila pilipes TaxID=299642 RepID=A0A8X6R0J5_NEPPI|nr:hypothetical protein NPIL_310621 [Nephila pilipes]
MFREFLKIGVPSPAPDALVPHPGGRRDFVRVPQMPSVPRILLKNTNFAEANGGGRYPRIVADFTVQRRGHRIRDGAKLLNQGLRKSKITRHLKNGIVKRESKKQTIAKKFNEMSLKD